MSNNTSQHILSVSANLLGFCLFVITSLKVGNWTETHFIDEFTSVIAIILTVSCIFSFISIRTKDPLRETLCETIADYFFLIALIGILLVIIFITLNLIK